MKRLSHRPTPFVLGLCLLIHHAGSAHEATGDRIQRLTAGIEEASNEAWRYLQRAELHRKRGDWDAAEADYTHAKALAPDTAEIDLAHAQMQLESGRPLLSLQTIEPVTERVPAAALPIRAGALTSLGRMDEAASDYLTAIDATARPPTDLFLDCARAFLAAGEPDRALQVLEERCRADNSPFVLEMVGLEIELQLQRHEQALHRIWRVLETLDRKEKWHVLEGDVLSRMGRISEARRAYSNALQEIDNLPAVRRRTSVMIELKQRTSLALAAVEGPSSDP